MNLSSALSLALPEVILAASALILVVWGAFQGRSNPIFSGAAVLVLLAAAAVAAMGPHGVAFNGAYVADGVAAFAKVAIYIASALAIPLGDKWLGARGDAKFEFPILIVLTALG
ncbi:MAG: NADH-quinone oxidoreductase subunit N, partial [Caulobacter sp.]